MYNNPYEVYMRNSLGYNQMPMMDMNYMNPMNEIYEDENSCTYNQTSVDDMYPEIYRIIYPMVCKACMAVDENVSEDLVSRITNDIYVNVENMELGCETRSSSISAASSKSDTSGKINPSAANNVSNVRQQETRQRNPLLRDLIRILVLRELLGRPRPPFRPPFGGGPGMRPRPPFGGGFGPGMRPTLGF